MIVTYLFCIPVAPQGECSSQNGRKGFIYPGMNYLKPGGKYGHFYPFVSQKLPDSDFATCTEKTLENNKNAIGWVNYAGVADTPGNCNALGFHTGTVLIVEGFATNMCIFGQFSNVIALNVESTQLY